MSQMNISPSVFISSTIKEFRDIRSAVAYNLRAQGFRVHQSELADFDVRGDRSAAEECFTNIRNCNYYILLVGNQRGSFYTEGVSITRQEYRVARDAFLANNHPVLFLYLQESTEVALKGDKVDIDDPKHLESFIDEIQRPGIANAPSFLIRFHDFGALMDSLALKMNLGKNLSEKILRLTLLSELLNNLTCMVNRTGTSVYPLHRYMWKTRETLQIEPADLGKVVLINDDQVISLALSLVGRTRGENLSLHAIENAIAAGIFLKFSSIDGTFHETSLHKMLQQLLEDIQMLQRRDKIAQGDEWDIKIGEAISTKWHGRPNSLTISGFYLISALSYYDLMENIFNQHLALCQVLLGFT